MLGRTRFRYHMNAAALLKVAFKLRAAEATTLEKFLRFS